MFSQFSYRPLSKLASDIARKSKRNIFKLSILVIIVIIIIIIVILTLPREEPRVSKCGSPQFPATRNHFNGTPPSTSKVIICANSCAENASDAHFLETTVVMLKSVLISAKLNNVKEVDFHLFVEHNEHQKLLNNELLNFEKGISNAFNLSIIFHDPMKVNKIIPAEFQGQMVYHKRFRCGFVRMFFPSLLPDVDAVIYLDSDMIVTGSIVKFWENFYFMTGSQLVGVANNEEIESTFYLCNNYFGGIPFVPPMGVNSGLMLMSLTKMRAFGWEEKLLQVYSDYTKIHSITDQLTLNIFLYLNPDLLLQLGCEFNFIHTNCDRGFVCKNAETVGIHGFHGANKNFRPDRSFRKIWESYQHFDIVNGDVDRDIVSPLRRWYSDTSGQSSQCFGTLNKYMYTGKT